MSLVRPALLLLALSALAARSAPAQPPKGAPKLNLVKIQAAETALGKQGCQFDRVKDKDSPLFGHAKLVKFPAITTDADLNRLISSLAQLPALAAVDLGDTRITDKSGANLAKLPNLTALYLDNTGVGGETVKALAALDALEWLDLNYTRVKGNEIAPVAKLVRLRYLFAAGLSVTDEDLAPLSSLVALRTLDLSNNAIDGGGLKQLHGAKDLTELRLDLQWPQTVAFRGQKKASTSDVTAKACAGFTNLESLTLTYSEKVTDAGVSELTACTKLKALKLERTGVTFTEIKGLDKLVALERLKLGRNKIGDDGLKAISELRGLKELVLYETRVTDDGLKHLKGLPDLEILNIASTGIKGKGFDALLGSRSLKNLTIGGTPVTDAAVRSLAAIKSLQMVWALETRISPATKAAVESARPGCVVHLTVVAGTGIPGLRLPAGGGGAASGSRP